SSGPADFPFARAEVLALLPNISSSFKISRAAEWMGTITEDRNAAISGLTRRQARMTPIEIKVGTNVYRMKMVEDRVMTPLLAQMALASAIDTTEHAIGPSTYTVKGRINFVNGASAPIETVTTGDLGVAPLTALAAGTPLGYALGSGFDELR